MTEPLRILHISDTHLLGDGTLHHGLVDTTAALRRVLAVAGELDAVDLVVASGDLSDDGSEQSYRTLRALIDPWAAERGASVVYAMGNHDQRAGFQAVMGPLRGVSEVAGRRVVHLDSSVPERGYGEVDADQLAWLESVLATPARHGTVVVLHHPPTPASTALLQALELQHPKRLLDVCSAGGVRAILSGHYHHPLVAQEHGIPVIVAPGVANTTDVLAPTGRERATAGAAFGYLELPVEGTPRVTFASAPSRADDQHAGGSPADGLVLFDLEPHQVLAIAEAAGVRR